VARSFGIRARAAIAPLAALASLAVGGCASDGAVSVTRWTLSVPEAPEPLAIELPTRFELPDRDLEYSLVTTVELPASWRGAPLTLSIDHLFADAALWINGVEMPGLFHRAPGGYRGDGPVGWSIPASFTADGPVRLELRVRHNWALGAWFDTVPHLRPGLDNAPRAAFVRSFNRSTALLGFGTLMTISFTYLLLFAIQRERRWYGWLALQMACASVYLLFIAGHLEGVGRVAEVPLFSFTMSMAVISSVYAVNARFELGPPSRAWAWLAVAHVVVVVATLGPFTTYRYYGALAVITITGINAVHIWRLTVLTRRRPRQPGVLPNLVAWWLVVFTAPFDGIPWLGLPDVVSGLRLGSLGLAAYALIMFVALCGDHLRSLRRADALNAELSRGLERIESLNDELQRQVGERSRQLAEAMARLAHGNMGPPKVEPGDVINDRYRVLERIGAGAMGAVYRVERTTDGAVFAAKVLTGAAGAAQLSRFAREAQTASEIRHDNVVAVVDVDFSTAGYMFLVMEYVDGPCLKDLDGKFGTVSWALEALAEIAAGVAAIHESGIVHRDLKPANVLVTRQDPPRVKITDFGIATAVADTADAAGAGAPAPAASAIASVAAASFSSASTATATGQGGPGPSAAPVSDSALAALRAHIEGGAGDATGRTGGSAFTLAGSTAGSAGGSQLTRTGALLGTPVYMAPELAHGAKFASEASDVFSLGVMAFEMLTGRRPFAVPPCLARSTGTPIEEPPSLTDRCPELDSAVVAVLTRALAVDPERRPGAAEVAAVLRGTDEKRASAVAVTALADRPL